MNRRSGRQPPEWTGYFFAERRSSDGRWAVPLTTKNEAARARARIGTWDQTTRLEIVRSDRHPTDWDVVEAAS